MLRNPEAMRDEARQNLDNLNHVVECWYALACAYLCAGDAENTLFALDRAQMTENRLDISKRLYQRLCETDGRP